MYEITSCTYEYAVQPYLEDITQLREAGEGVKSIVKYLENKSNIDIPVVVFLRYIKLYQDLYRAWYEGNMELILKLEDTALKLATGYEYTEKEEIVTTNDKGDEVITVKTKTKHKAGDKDLIKELLRVNHPGRWVDNKREDREIIIKMPKELEEFCE